MAELAPIPRGPAADAAFDVRALFAQGLDHVRTLAREQWTDHNTHDPGITILELLCYALTDVAYRSSLPIAHLVARDGAAATAAQFHRASAILPNRPFTADDWRRALIDLADVKNAWIESVDSETLIADLRLRQLRRDPPDHPDWQTVVLRGLQRVRIEFMDSVATPVQRDEVLGRVRALLQAQRNLCEDVIDVRPVKAQYFSLCAELDLDIGADVTEVAARLLFELGQAIAPSVPNHPLAEMLARGQALPDVLEGPLLSHGVIDGDDLAATVLPSEIRLSDLIGVAMDVPGMRSVRELQMNPLQRADEDDDDAPDANPAAVVAGALPVTNPWRVPVRAGRLPRLSLAQGRLVFSKRGMPVAGWQIAAMPAAVRTQLQALRESARVKVETATTMDVPFPPGRQRALAAWRSFQHDFPALYGIGAVGLPGRPDDLRRAQALQLQGYLLFFDQWLAGQTATLAQGSQRLSVAPADLQAVASGWTLQPDAQHVLPAQRVESIIDVDEIYDADVTVQLLANFAESPTEAAARQQQALDHLLARLGEDFADYVAVIASAFDTGAPKAIADKCAFLEDAAALGHDRAGAYAQFPATDAEAWNTASVSGLERRIARLLGITDFTRRDLSGLTADSGEGLYVVEHLLLRPTEPADPILPICTDPGCDDCTDIDPYSWRLHIVLPAYAGRFTSMAFRNFAEETIRREVPAHLLPTVCWIGADDMARFEKAWHDWIALHAGLQTTGRTQKLQALIDALVSVKNIYPTHKLFDCTTDETKPPFILGRTSLGSTPPA